MKKTFVLLLAMALTLALLPAAGEETVTEDVAAALAHFTGLSGDVVFQLPGGPSRMTDYDYPGRFTDSRQLLGYCVEDGMEYQLRTADIGPWVESIREDVMAQVPEATEDIVRVNALLGYGMLMPGTYDAELLSAKPHGYNDRDWLWLEATFVYPDTPGVTYHLKAMLSGTRATTLIIGECPHAQTVLEALRFVEEEELEALRTELTAAVTVDIGGLSATFPRRPITVEANSSAIIGTFSIDWSNMQVQYAEYHAGIPEGTELESMIAIGKKAITPYDTDAVNDPVLSRPAEDMLQLDFKFVDGRHFGEYGPSMLVRVYAGARGVWYVTASDDETGRQFMESLRLTDPDALSSEAIEP